MLRDMLLVGYMDVSNGKDEGMFAFSRARMANDCGRAGFFLLRYHFDRAP